MKSLTLYITTAAHPCLLAQLFPTNGFLKVELLTQKEFAN